MSMGTSLLKPLFSKIHFGRNASEQSRPFRVNYQPNGYQVRWTLKQWAKTAPDPFGRDRRLSATPKIAHNILRTIQEPSFKANPNHFKVITAHSGSGKIRAVCLLHTPPNQSAAYVAQLVSAPKTKAKGSGKAALFAAQQHAQKAGYQSITLLPCNHQVSQFYQRYGYTPSSRGTGLLELDLQA